MSAQIILIPSGRIVDTSQSLMARGYYVSNVRGRKRSLVVAAPVPTLTNVVSLHKRPAHSVLEWLR